MKTYKVWAKSTSHYYAFIEASDSDEAWDKALAMDGAEFIPLDQGIDSSIERLGIRGWMFNVPPTHSTDVRMSAGTNPPPILTRPVAQIVLALPTGLSPIRYLIPLHTRSTKTFIRHDVAMCHDVIVGDNDISTCNLSAQGSSVFNDQCVRADVVWFDF